MKRLLAHLQLEKFSNVAHQLVLLIITVTILLLLLYKPVVEFHPVGPKPIIKPATQEITSTWDTQPVHVQTGMHLTDFLKFDAVKNEFTINAFIWFAFDPSKVSLETIDAFAFTKGEITQKSKANVRRLYENTDLALYSIRVQFSSILDYKRFPLDDHRLFLNITNPTSTANELIYDVNPDDFIISPNIYVSGWQVVGKNAQSGYAPVSLGITALLQNKTVFSLDLSKSDLRQLSLIILPLLFLFYLGLFAFSLSDITVAMTLPLASIASLFAYSFVIQTLAPQVGYMMLSDYLFIFFLLSSFVVFLVKALAIVPEHILSRRNLKRIEGLTVIVLHVALVVVWYILITP